MRTYIPTYVTTHSKSLYMLEPFLRLAKKYYPKEREILVDIAEEGQQHNGTEAKSEQLKRIIKNTDGEYIIFLEEDFLIFKLVIPELLDDICDFCIQEKVDRFTLQSKNAYAVSNWTATDKKIGDKVVYNATPEVLSRFGLDATVWNKEFMLKYLGVNQDDHQLEIHSSRKLLGTSCKIYGLDEFVISYEDGIRRGKQVIDPETIS